MWNDFLGRGENLRKGKKALKKGIHEGTRVGGYDLQEKEDH